MSEPRVLITGAAGYVGGQLGALLSKQMPVVGVDIQHRETTFPLFVMDICDGALAELMRAERITHVVHLASVVSPGRDRAREYQIDVEGTRNVLDACITAGVEHLTLTSSGAAYGYHADNPSWLVENSPLRGNPEFAYSDHKRLVEEMLAEYRQKHPQLKQLIFRPCSIIGATTNSKISELFAGSSILDPGGHNSPFVFIWDEDVIGAIEYGVTRSASGIYNLAGDGALTPAEIARLLGKPVRRPPVWLLKVLLGISYYLRLGNVRPAQIMFLQYRPVLLNTRLKTELGYQPKKTSAEAFAYFATRALGIAVEADTARVSFSDDAISEGQPA
ncbi:SDR family oxidoreductase [Microbulbifer hydrolyticus]|uniref:NAD-dependent epimerase/dehydratase family protein n=1 Tax=Microbulbifer hydrolyticus TaxID=48074 RepID=A0A6P1TA09_9GAMM|nr:SDR family oxidoreductase [Microbulbifer hydrolyticus]MBB5210707.1 UDP-glucose 4-epimerase [Microbulbifer hydrolyticus]QHQ38837.1 NAD-dependent epimerase/dehydratase family protein [Microbulbifer hydrolyticus]